MTAISARSMARPLLADLKNRPFSGRVLGVHRRACNLIDDTGWIITVVLPMVGNGPFAVMIEDTPGIFERLKPHQPVRATRRTLTLGERQILLDRAAIWEPQLPRPARPLNLELMLDLIEPYAVWPTFAEQSLLAERTAHLARQAAGQLMLALKQPQEMTALEAAVAKLAGLGSGLTPAGDDFLMGSMVALWLTKQPGPLTTIAEVAGSKTNTLSRAFLRAAAQGEFIEPWHALIHIWQQENQESIINAIKWIARFGASSGLDALAGFANTLLVKA